MKMDERSGRFRWQTLLLYAGFLGTGVGVALPGVLLPVFLLNWHLRDEQAGQLFLLAWAGSSLGALAVRGSLRTCLALGSATIALAAAGLALCHGSGADALIALYGLGLGTTMTSISLIRQQQTAGRGTEMVRLNLIWAIGACVCPSLALHSVAAARSGPILFAMSVLFTGLAAVTPMQSRLQMQQPRVEREPARGVRRRVPLGLLVLVFLVTGIEASAGGWLTTYTRRGGYTFAETIAAPTCFWAGLLMSRLFWTVTGARVSEAWTVRMSLAAMAIASLALLVTGSGGLLLAAAFCLGFGLGPTYPLLIAWALRVRRGGTIFFIAGVGSACLPWLTGLVSTREGSLRVGFAVPAAGSLVMVLIALLAPLATWARQGTVQDQTK